MWLLFIPIALVLALVLAAAFAAGLVLFGAGALVVAIVRHVPWLLVLLGVWLLVRPGYGRRRYRRTWSTAPSWSAPAAAPPAPTPSTAAPAAQPVAQRPRPAPEPPPKRELPIDLRVKVEQIRHKADVLLGYAERFPPFSHELHIVRQTAADYLPRTVEAYLALPGTDDPVVTATGKTALQELREQLFLLDSKLDDIAQDLQRQDVDRLLANRRFLEERFRPREAGAEGGAEEPAA